jgi:prepilin-type N-terminal cleavage/methylation domain-containing protein
MKTSHRARDLDDGFTLVELLVATFVLLVGVLGVLTLLTGALRTTAANNERVGATNLARELVEETRSLDYDDMTGSLVPSRLQARGLGSGSPWTIQRRQTTYTITATSCTYDDPTDKLAATPPAGVCTPQPAGVTGDSNGEDFRRTTFQVAWRETGGVQRSVTQTTLVVNPSGGLGPRIVSFNPITQTITSNVSSATIVWTTTPATTLRWAADDGASSGSSTGSTSFTTNWDIGTSGGSGEILDGSYEISGQPFDDRDIAGEAKRAQVVLNRRQPYQPPSLGGGHDTRVDDWVDLQWSPNAERDILGYRVMWAGPDGIAGNGNDTQVCPAPAVGTMLENTTTSCADRSPPAGATTYYIVAVDRAPDNQLRDGDRRTLSVDAAASQRPRQPGGPLVAQTVENQPTLTWSAPSGSSPSFYRIYRDGTAIGYTDRYGRTSGNTTQFTDDGPGAGGHTYWVTAVDSSYNESDPLGPVTWSP